MKQKLNAKAIRQMDKEEREKLLNQLRNELIKLISQKERGVVENPGRIKAIKKAIARILTIENEENLREKILNFLSSNKGKAFTIEEICKKINENRIDFVKHMIQRLLIENKIKKIGLRKYMITP